MGPQPQKPTPTLWSDVRVRRRGRPLTFTRLVLILLLVLLVFLVLLPGPEASGGLQLLFTLPSQERMDPHSLLPGYTAQVRGGQRRLLFLHL